MATIKRELMLTVYAGLLVLSLYGAGAFSFSSKSISSFATLKPSSLKMVEERPSMDDGGPAGSFFHQVPESDENLSPEAASSNEIDGDTNDKTTNSSSDDDFDDAISKLIRQRRKPPRSSRLSTINGVPTEKSTGFGKTKQGKASGDSSISSSSSSSSSTKKNPSSNKPYIAIGQPDNNQIKSQQPINDPSKPERDDQGYTLYTDTETGEKSRVFEALVEYPSIFTMKIVGANEGMFVQEMVAVVAEACESSLDEITHTTKVNGKWISITVQAPVKSAEMLYTLYEKIDLDPRVKFKF